MKKRLIGLLAIELLVACFVITPVCILRRAEVRAYAAWHEHPNAETRAALNRERRITMGHKAGFSVTVFAAMAGVTLLVARARDRRLRPVPVA